MKLWDNAALWRNLTFAFAALTLLAVGAALLLTVPLGARGPAPRPTVAVLVDEARRAVWLALANPAGTRLELRALQPIAPPPGRVFALWLIDRPGAVPRALGPLPQGGRAIDQLPVLLRPGATLGVSLEPAGDDAVSAPSGPLEQSGTVVATDALPALGISTSTPEQNEPGERAPISGNP
jgi:anti-sigma-K factor RskA